MKNACFLLVLRPEEAEGVSLTFPLEVQGVSVVIGGSKGWSLGGHSNKGPWGWLGRLLEIEC